MFRRLLTGSRPPFHSPSMPIECSPSITIDTYFSCKATLAPFIKASITLEYAVWLHSTALKNHLQCNATVTDTVSALSGSGSRILFSASFSTVNCTWPERRPIEGERQKRTSLNGEKRRKNHKTATAGGHPCGRGALLLSTLSVCMPSACTVQALQMVFCRDILLSPQQDPRPPALVDPSPASLPSRKMDVESTDEALHGVQGVN